jgi:hypothetical protein
VSHRRVRKLATTAIVAEAAGGVRTLEEIAQDPRSWKGAMREFFEAVARDPTHPLELRLHCAAVLLKDQQGQPDNDRQRTLAPIDVAALPPHLRRPFEDILLFAELQRCERAAPGGATGNGAGTNGAQQPPVLTIEHDAEETEDERSAGNAAD